MNDMKKRSMIQACSLLALGVTMALSSFACTESPVGIFYQVASEKDINANLTEGLKEATPTFVARLATTSYLGAGSLWTKADAEAKWTLKSIVTGVSTSAVLAVSGVADASKLYVLFYSPSSDTSLGIWATPNGTDWTQVGGIPSDETVERLLAANGQVFAVTRKAVGAETGYSIHYLSGTAFAATGISANADIGSPDSVAYAGATYWFTAGGYLLAGATMPGLAKVTGPNDWTTPSTAASPLASRYGGICAVGNDIVVSDRSGILYYGTSWTKSAQQSYSSSSAYSFSVPTYVGVGAKPLVVVGTDTVARASADLPTAYGYMEYAASGLATAGAAPDAAHATLADATNYASTLSGKIVTAMPLVDLGGGSYKLYALTQGAGLWSNAYNGVAWGTWVRE